VAKRARAARREEQRAADKLARAREKLFALSPGGTPERPIEAVSASVVEPAARAIRCPRCEGTLRVEEHAVDHAGSATLRVVRARCIACGAPRSIWFHLPVVH
jgi:hypothetical protein